MNHKGPYMRKNITIGTTLRRISLILFCLLPLKGICQTGEATVDALVKMGFENVGWTEDTEERVFVIQNSAYRLEGVGIGKAVDLIQKMGLPENKPCRLIVLDNNVPQISLYYQPMKGDSIAEVSRADWSVSYDLGEGWKQARRIKKQNSSLFKVDIVVYPELLFRNYILSKVYEIVVNVSPAIEVSLWKGMKLTGQVIFPIYNDYGQRYKQIRPGFVTLSQTVRLPQRTFLTASVGFFNKFRWGGDLKAKHFFKDERFSVDARIGYTGRGYFEDWAFYHGTKWTLTGSIGANFYWPKYNTQFSLKGERYLEGEYGARFDMIRHFRYASIGFYGMKVQHAGNKGLNGGFLFQIALPPYKYKRKGYIPRVIPNNFGFQYNAGNERIYGKGYSPQASDNVMENNSFNPYLIKSELLNF